MTDFDRIVTVKEAAEAGLRAIPGVHAVGLGAKVVAGNRTSEPSIAVFVKKKKPASAIPPDEAIPPEIDGIKTDVIEMEIPSRALAKDTTRYRPVAGGCCIRAGGSPEYGTLGCLALTSDTPPKVVALTCQHVVAPPQAAQTTLNEVFVPATSNPATVSATVGENNTPGTVIVARFGMVNASNVVTAYVGAAFYETKASDTVQTIGAALAAAIGAMKVAGIAGATSNSATGAVTVTFDPSSGVKWIDCPCYDPVSPTDAHLTAAIMGGTVTFAGTVDRDYGIFLVWNVDGATVTNGVFIAAPKGAAITDTVNSAIGAVNKLGAAGVTAKPAGTAGFTLSGVAEIDCLITKDLRIGQPKDSFSSSCSLCCNDEIGKVIGANIGLDIAVVQLMTGTQYLNETKWIPWDGSSDTQNNLVTGKYLDFRARDQRRISGPEIRRNDAVDVGNRPLQQRHGSIRRQPDPERDHFLPLLHERADGHQQPEPLFRARCAHGLLRTRRFRFSGHQFRRASGGNPVRQ